MEAEAAKGARPAGVAELNVANVRALGRKPRKRAPQQQQQQQQQKKKMTKKKARTQAGKHLAAVSAQQQRQPPSVGALMQQVADGSAYAAPARKAARALRAKPSQAWRQHYGDFATDVPPPRAQRTRGGASYTSDYKAQYEREKHALGDKLLRKARR
jgi:hypothetical protein